MTKLPLNCVIAFGGPPTGVSPFLQALNLTALSPSSILYALRSFQAAGL